MIKHFIYDFDGTLSDSYPVFLKIVRKIARQNGAITTATDAEIHRKMKERTIKAIALFQWSGEMSRQDFEVQFQRLQLEYANEFALYPHAIELLEAVIKSGKKNYLYTHSGKPVYKIMENMGISKYFTYVLDASQGFASKPAPDALQFLCEKFGIDPKEAMMIGDRPIDVQAGANAGMQSCMFDPDGYYADEPATYYKTSLKDVMELIQN